MLHCCCSAISKICENLQLNRLQGVQEDEYNLVFQNLMIRILDFNLRLSPTPNSSEKSDLPLRKLRSDPEERLKRECQYMAKNFDPECLSDDRARQVCQQIQQCWRNDRRLLVTTCHPLTDEVDGIPVEELHVDYVMDVQRLVELIDRMTPAKRIQGRDLNGRGMSVPSGDTVVRAWSVIQSFQCLSDRLGQFAGEHDRSI